MTRVWFHGALLAALAIGCGEPADAPAPAPKSAASAAPATATPKSTAPASKSAAKAPAALRKAWRQSIKYRSSFKALVENVGGFKTDTTRMAKLTKQSRMYEIIPVAPQPAKDAEALRKTLAFHGERLGLKDIEIDVRTNLPAKAPPPTVTHTDGIRYTAEQLLGRHRISISFAKRSDAEKWIRAVRQLPRTPLIERIRTQKGRTVATGYAPYFTDLQPAKVLRPQPKVDVILRMAGGADSPTADKLRANYAEVDALAPRIEEAFTLEAKLKLTTSRFSHFTAHAKALEKMSWLALTGVVKPKAHRDH